MYQILKRIIDLVISVFALLILLPFMIPIVVILLLTGEHHIFYYQKRIGYKNQYFNIIKFATMLKNSPNIGTGTLTVRNDPRLLPLGRFLRMTKINELPQILNVIKGDMSIVGPRPLVDISFNSYDENTRNKIYESKPGITGIGSIVFRDEEDLITNSGLSPQECYDNIIAPYKGGLEMWYNKHRSLKIDFWIIFLTGWVIIKPNSKLQYKIFRDLPAPVSI